MIHLKIQKFLKLPSRTIEKNSTTIHALPLPTRRIRKQCTFNAKANLSGDFSIRCISEWSLKYVLKSLLVDNISKSIGCDEYVCRIHTCRYPLVKSAIFDHISEKSNQATAKLKSEHTPDTNAANKVANNTASWIVERNAITVPLFKIQKYSNCSAYAPQKCWYCEEYFQYVWVDCIECF